MPILRSSGATADDAALPRMTVANEFSQWTPSPSKKRKELQQKFVRHPVPFVEAHQNIYVLTPKGKGQNLTSDHVTPRSSWVKIGKIAYHSIRLEEANTIRPRASLYLISVISYRHKTCHMSGTENRNFQVKFRFARIYFLNNFGVSMTKKTQSIKNYYWKTNH